MENNETIKFINAQALIVTAIFGLFGGALTNFLDVPELKIRYIGMACLLGLVLILLIKLLLKAPKKTRTKLILKVIAVVLVVALFISFFSFDRSFSDYTFKYRDIDSVSSNYIKGSDEGLQQGAKEFIAKFEKDKGRIPSDQELIDNAGGIYEEAGINNIQSVWKPASILLAKRILIRSYIIMAMFFLASIYFIAEVTLIFFADKKKKAPKVLKETRFKRSPS